MGIAISLARDKTRKYKKCLSKDMKMGHLKYFHTRFSQQFVHNPNVLIINSVEHRREDCCLVINTI